MGQIEDSLSTADRMFKASQNRNKQKRKFGPVNKTRLHTFFRETFRDLGYGDPPLASQKELQMLSGFIRLAKKEGMEDSEIYEFFEKVIKNWDHLRMREYTTLKGKRWLMGPRPLLSDIIFCHKGLRAYLSQDDANWEEDEADVELPEQLAEFIQGIPDKEG